MVHVSIVVNINNYGRNVLRSVWFATMVAIVVLQWVNIDMLHTLEHHVVAENNINKF